MDTLFPKYRQKLRTMAPVRPRYLLEEIDWNDRLISIKGARGVGKTTLILQYIKSYLPIDKQTLYVSLDDIYFQSNKLVHLAEKFVVNGGKYLFLDEVHKYPNWSIELKNIYDDFPQLKVVFTGSALLEIYKGDGDLSRRAIGYELFGFSFREFLEAETGASFPVLTLDNIFSNHYKLATELSHQLQPIPYFKEYLRHGYYPFFLENRKNYHIRLANVVNWVLETDLPAITNITYSTVNKLKRLLYMIATSVPFKPSISRLSEKIGISRAQVVQYMDYMARAHIINLLKRATKGIGHLTKPDKIYLQNTNLAYALPPESPDKGTLRETFLLTQLQKNHHTYLSEKGDFLIDKKWTIEVGGRNKTTKQIAGLPNAYVAADDMEIGFNNTIPLWLFGFLY